MEFDAAVGELDALVQTLEREGDERALMLLDLVDAIHRPALERLAEGERDHRIVQAVLAMYELVPLPDEFYVEDALDEVRPHVEEHGGSVELIEIDDGVVHLRLGGACRTGSESAAELREGIERALRDRYPGFREMVAQEPDAGMALPLAAAPAAQAAPAPEPAPVAEPARSGGPRVLSIEGLSEPEAAEPGPPDAEPPDSEPSGAEPPDGPRRLRRPVFSEVGSTSDVPRGQMRAVDADGTPVLIVNLDGQVYGFKNICPTDGRSPMDGGRLTSGVIVCPWHNCAYDARSGKRVDGEPGAGLAVVPVAVRDGSLQVAVSAG
ncbi:MAG: NifU family protein [Actinomycetota bacterium]|nr:NifU family protein [Actinomycetota bacterium]